MECLLFFAFIRPMIFVISDGNPSHKFPSSNMNPVHFTYPNQFHFTIFPRFLFCILSNFPVKDRFLKRAAIFVFKFVSIGI